MIRETITNEHVRDLLESRAMDAALVRYRENGALEVRSTIPTRVPALDDYTIIIKREALADVDQSGMDFSDNGAHLSKTDLEALAAQLAYGEDSAENDE